MGTQNLLVLNSKNPAQRGAEVQSWAPEEDSSYQGPEGGARGGTGPHQGQNVSPQCKKSHKERRTLKHGDSTAIVLSSTCFFLPPVANQLF